MIAEWFYAKGKQKVGPVTKAQLQELVRSGELSPADMVWKQGMTKWQPAGAANGLLPQSPPAQPEPTIPLKVITITQHELIVDGSNQALHFKKGKANTDERWEESVEKTKEFLKQAAIVTGLVSSFTPTNCYER